MKIKLNEYLSVEGIDAWAGEQNEIFAARRLLIERLGSRIEDVKDRRLLASVFGYLGTGLRTVHGSRQGARALKGHSANMREAVIVELKAIGHAFPAARPAREGGLREPVVEPDQGQPEDIFSGSCGTSSLPIRARHQRNSLRTSSTR